MSTERHFMGQGPFKPSQIRTGDRWEISNGNAVYCAPTGGDGARRTGTAFSVIDSDPAVDDAGVDPGFTPDGGTLRAPDVAVGVPDAPGWVAGAPPLAIEYAGRGQDEPELQTKIAELLAAGTRWVWVVRLVGRRRVEVHAPGASMRTAVLGEVLAAPGILKNPVPVLALFDREAAHEVTLTNLLQRRGYADLESALAEERAEGREQGREQGLEQGLEQGREQGLEQGREQGRSAGQRQAEIALLTRQLTHRFGPLDDDARARLDAGNAADRADWAERLLTAPTLTAVFDANGRDEPLPG